MECLRCHQEFDEDTPWRNTTYTGELSYYACPHCGKLYEFRREVVFEAVPDEDIHYDNDDWNNPVVKDKDYQKV